MVESLVLLHPRLCFVLLYLNKHDCCHTDLSFSWLDCGALWRRNTPYCMKQLLKRTWFNIFVQIQLNCLVEEKPVIGGRNLFCQVRPVILWLNDRCTGQIKWQSDPLSLWSWFIMLHLQALRCMFSFCLKTRWQQLITRLESIKFDDFAGVHKIMMGI